MEFKTNECSCATCVGMCEHRPCWGTPEEIEKIIEAGLGDRLMNDYWIESPQDVQIFSPAIVGYEGRTAPFMPIGACTFLKNGLCELHDKGLKPLEGRTATCKSSKQAREQHNKVRKFIVDEWREKQNNDV
jgi:Fe-S-cluster containining protein